jgi:hypothetical protein
MVGKVTMDGQGRGRRRAGWFRNYVIFVGGGLEGKRSEARRVSCVRDCTCNYRGIGSWYPRVWGHDMTFYLAW